MLCVVVVVVAMAAARRAVAAAAGSACRAATAARAAGAKGSPSGAAAAASGGVQAAPGPCSKLNFATRPDSYDAELRAKVDGLVAAFAAAGRALPAEGVEVFASPPEHFRMRCEFRVWHTEGDAGRPLLQYVMFDGKQPVAVPRFPMADASVCDGLMPELLAALGDDPALRQKCFQANFHATLAGDAMVSLLYHRKLDAEWEAAAARLRERLGGASIIGRSRKQKVVVGRDYVEERLRVAGSPAPISYRQVEGAFAQPNASVCQHMLAWARAVAGSDGGATGAPPCPPREDDLLELYCGNGNFSVALAPLFRRVLATELSKVLTATAKHNAVANGVENLEFARLSAEELAQALSGERNYQRLQHVDLASYDIRTVLVDPPRAGCGPEVSAFLTRFDRVVYVSCNPETLRADLETLGETHDVARLAAFDQFPYTDHIECGALLVRRGSRDE